MIRPPARFTGGERIFVWLLGMAFVVAGSTIGQSIRRLPHERHQRRRAAAILNLPVRQVVPTRWHCGDGVQFFEVTDEKGDQTGAIIVDGQGQPVCIRLKLMHAAAGQDGDTTVELAGSARKAVGTYWSLSPQELQLSGHQSDGDSIGALTLLHGEQDLQRGS